MTAYRFYRNEATRSSLLRAVGEDGNDSAWARFFDTYAGYVFAIARKRGLQGTDADEIVQTVFLELQKKGGLSGYDREKGAFHTWLAGLTIWRVKDLFRKRATEAQKVTCSPGEELDGRFQASRNQIDELFEEEWREAVRQKALFKLREQVNPVHFSIFHALCFEEIDSEAVGKIYGVTRNNLYQIRSRMKIAFRKLLEEAAKEMDAPDLP